MKSIMLLFFAFLLANVFLTNRSFSQDCPQGYEEGPLPIYIQLGFIIPYNEMPECAFECPFYIKYCYKETKDASGNITLSFWFIEKYIYCPNRNCNKLLAELIDKYWADIESNFLDQVFSRDGYLFPLEKIPDINDPQSNKYFEILTYQATCRSDEMVAIGVRPCFDPQFGWTVMPVYAYVDCIGSGECVSVYEASSEVINGQTHYYHNLVLKYATGNETCPNEYMYLGVDESNPSLFRWYAVTCNYKCD